MGFRTDNAVVVPWAAKYLFTRKSPCQRAMDVTPVVPINGDGLAPEPSYPSKHGAMAGTGVSILTVFFPKEETHLKAMAAEAGQTRLWMGANYRSDIEAGFALRQAVAQNALARAATDGWDAKWTGMVPTGQGLWIGKDPLEPRAECRGYSRQTYSASPCLLPPSPSCPPSQLLSG
jgi:hypothetical protein